MALPGGCLSNGVSRYSRSSGKNERRALRARNYGFLYTSRFYRKSLKLLKKFRNFPNFWLILKKYWKNAVIGFVGAFFMMILSVTGCTNQEENIIDNGTSTGGNITTNVMRETRAVEFRVPTENGDGKFNNQVSNLYFNTDSMRWQVDLEWLPEFQNRVEDMQISITSLPTYLDSVTELTFVNIWLQGYFDPERPTNITHIPDRGQIYDQGDRQYAIVSLNDLTLLSEKFNTLINGLNENVYAMVRADLHNGARMAEYICVDDDPRFQHIWGEWSEYLVDTTVVPTCVDNGKITKTRFRTCIVAGCNERHDDQPEIEEIPANGHDFSDWSIPMFDSVLVEPSCSAVGSKRMKSHRACVVCDDGTEEKLDTVVIPATIPNDLREFMNCADLSGRNLDGRNFQRVRLPRSHGAVSFNDLIGLNKGIKSGDSYIYESANGGANYTDYAYVYNRDGRIPGVTGVKDTVIYKFVDYHNTPDGRRALSIQDPKGCP